MTNEDLNVLIVDDDPVVRRLTNRIIASFGFSTITAENGVEALATCASDQSVDLVISDMLMPEMSGQELVAQLRAGDDCPRVILMSGSIPESNQADDGTILMPKPYTRESLREVIELALAQPLSAQPAMA